MFIEKKTAAYFYVQNTADWHCSAIKELTNAICSERELNNCRKKGGWASVTDKP